MAELFIKALSWIRKSSWLTILGVNFKHDPDEDELFFIILLIKYSVSELLEQSIFAMVI